ncbi:hypothetical protein [Natronorubrum texcoconense]|nr:hypothetical protein [Natronorubrum texcoconense]
MVRQIWPHVALNEAIRTVDGVGTDLIERRIGEIDALLEAIADGW